MSGAGPPWGSAPLRLCATPRTAQRLLSLGDFCRYHWFNPGYRTVSPHDEIRTAMMADAMSKQGVQPGSLRA
jgi:hypothetical protein